MKLKIAYDDRQTAKTNQSFSPSATKPALVVKAWEQMGIDFGRIPVIPATRKEIAKVHKRTMVDDILDLKRQNGFNNKLKEIADSLPWVCGSMMTAAREVLKNEGVCFSPTSGAHHAGWDFSGGYCTFNSLALAAITIREIDPTAKVGIIDCDAHYGNGTEDIIKEQGWHKWLTHFSMGKGNEKHAGYLRKLEQVLSRFKHVDVMIFNAGADPHEHDPLGGILSTGELQDRDRMVIQFCKDNHISMVIALAGGYQEDIKKVIEIHKNTFAIAHEIFCDGPKVAPYAKTSHGFDIFHDHRTSPLLPSFETEQETPEHKEFAPSSFLNDLDQLFEKYASDMETDEMLDLLKFYIKYAGE